MELLQRPSNSTNGNHKFTQRRTFYTATAMGFIQGRATRAGTHGVAATAEQFRQRQHWVHTAAISYSYNHGFMQRHQSGRHMKLLQRQSNTDDDNEFKATAEQLQQGQR